MERFDLRASVPPIDLATIEAEGPGEASAVVAERVAAARAERDTMAMRVGEDARSLLGRAIESSLLPSRDAHDRAVRVARTIACLAGERTVSEAHVSEAIDVTRDPL